MLIPRAAELLLIVYTDKGGDGSVWIYADSRGAYSVVVVADDDDEQKSIMRVNNEDEKHSGLSVVDARISRECFLDDSATFQELPRREQSCKHDAIAAQTASKYTERNVQVISQLTLQCLFVWRCSIGEKSGNFREVLSLLSLVLFVLVSCSHLAKFPSSRREKASNSVDKMALSRDFCAIRWRNSFVSTNAE